jgi:DNA-binding MarR family transcriptional regulator
MKTILQKLRRVEVDDYQMAERYYTILSAINNLKLTQRELQLIAFTAIRGNISYANIRKDFCEKYGTTNPSINNIISRLKKLGILVKDGSKVKVNSQILLNFENDITLEVRLVHG